MYYRIAKIAGKVPLRIVLIVPFVLQIFGTVGLVGYLSLKNGQKAVNDIASQLRSEISDRTSDRIRTYLATPHLINLTNADAITLGQLNTKNPKSLERHFLKQIQVFNSLSRIYFSNPQGGLISVANDETGLTVALTENLARGVLSVKATDSQGNRQKSLVSQQNYDARTRPFYQKAIEVGKATWSSIYIYVPTSRGLGIAASNPFYDQTGKLQGVLSSDLSLVSINNFLQSLKLGTHGKAFIIERSGMIVASSSSELPFVISTDGKEKKRLKVTEMKNPLIKATGQQLISNFGKLSNINAPRQLEFKIKGKRQFVQVTPFKDEFGLDWLIVVLVPESDFMQQINANTYTTIILCIIALIVATWIGVITARWITKPILCLNIAAKDIAQGKLAKDVTINRSDEVGELAKSFNSMAVQLQSSFATLKENENRLTQFLEALPVGVSIHDDTGKLSYLNQMARQLLGANVNPENSVEEIVAVYQVYRAGTNKLYPTEELPAFRALQGEAFKIEDMEIHQNGQIITLEVDTTPIFDKTGNVIYSIHAFTDITERQQTQKILDDYNETLERQVIRRTAELIISNEQLRQEIANRQRVEAEVIRSKDLFESIYNEAADAIFLVNAETLLITDCNRRAVELFEAESKDELINIEGRTLQKNSFTEEELKSIVDEISLKGFWSRELEYVTKKGKLFWGNLAAKEIYVAGQEMNLVRVKDITERKQAEQQLRESKRFLERIANASPNLWYIYDHIEQRNVYTNRELAAVLGYTPQEMEAMGSALLPTIVHPEDLAITFPLHLKKWETATDDDILDIEYRIRNAQGEWRTLLTLESVFERTPDGKVKQVIGTSTDISDRKQLEERLRDNALREKAIAHVLQRMRRSLNIDTIFSATTQELLNALKCDRVAIYRFNPDWSGQFVAESMAPGWIPMIVEQNNDLHLTDKALEDENCTIKSLNEDESLPDTYLQEIQGSLYTQGVSYRAVEDIYHANFTKCYINLLERFQAKAYINVPIFYGSKLWGLLASYQNSSPRTWSEGEIKVVVQIGTQLGIAVQQAQLLEETQQQAVELKLALDELQRTQVQLVQAEKMSSLGQMVAGIAHEINNPASFIQGNLVPANQYFQDLLKLLELYQQAYPNSTPEIQELSEEIEIEFLVEDCSKMINSMQIGTQRIRDIVLSMRNFSRLDENELKSVDIHEGIDNTLLILQHRLKAEGKRPEIKLVKEYGQLPLVKCYAGQLNQVFMNILSNAIDALATKPEPRLITIKSSVVSEQQTSTSVIVSITDNGSGMSESVKKKIFDPFFTTKPVGSGTGLGLSISYQIVVDKHQGKIHCNSASGEGTEFVVEIPISCQLKPQG